MRRSGVPSIPTVRSPAPCSARPPGVAGSGVARAGPAASTGPETPERSSRFEDVTLLGTAGDEPVALHGLRLLLDPAGLTLTAPDGAARHLAWDQVLSCHADGPPEPRGTPAARLLIATALARLQLVVPGIDAGVLTSALAAATGRHAEATEPARSRAGQGAGRGAGRAAHRPERASHRHGGKAHATALVHALRVALLVAAVAGAVALVLAQSAGAIHVRWLGG